MTVKSAIVFVGLDDFTVKQMPTDVHVTTRRRLLRWFQSLPATLDVDAIELIFSQARLSTTWSKSRKG